MFSVLGLIGLARKFGWRGWAVVAVAGAVLFLWTRGNQYQGEYVKQLQINRDLRQDIRWEDSLVEQRGDTLKGIGEYGKVQIDEPHPPVSRPESVPGDTVYMEPGDVGPQPVWIDSVGFDTSQWFGPEGEKFGVRVQGTFFWPPIHSSRNRLLIDPLGFEKSPRRLAEPQPEPKRWSVGLAAAVTSQQRPYGGVSVTVGRTSVIVLKGFSKSEWMVGAQYNFPLF